MRTLQKIGWAFFLLLAVCFLHAACQKEAGEEKQETYQFPVPVGFPQPNASALNPMSVKGIALGRYLYYDTLLSLGGPREGLACASCHLQAVGFTLPAQPVLAHVNLAWNKHFLWKGEISGTVEDAMLFEVKDFFEVDIPHLASRSIYKQMFKEAFGSEEVSLEKTAFALAQFIRSLVSGDSKFDQVGRGKAVFTDAENRGYAIFNSEIGDCFHCHGQALFTDNQFHNIGLSTKSSADLGRYLHTGSASDIGKFKTPTLRNIALKQVFMHDGRFKSLREVIEHYNKGVKKSEYLDPLLDKPHLDLSEEQINDLIAFLTTLTDQTFLKNPEHAKP